MQATETPIPAKAVPTVMQPIGLPQSGWVRDDEFAKALGIEAKTLRDFVRKNDGGVDAGVVRIGTILLLYMPVFYEYLARTQAASVESANEFIAVYRADRGNTCASTQEEGVRVRDDVSNK